MGSTLVEEIVKAAEPSAEFRSIWTDLRNVAFEQGWLDVKGTKIRYLRSGAGKPRKVIMLPGTGGHAETFAPNLGPLGEQFECWAIDIPGCGYSDKPDVFYDSRYIAAFLKDMAEVIGAGQVDLVGCSVGSWAALQAAHLYPELVRRVVLVSPGGGPVPDENDEWYEFWNLPDIATAMGGSEGEARREIVKHPTWEAAETILTGLVPDRRRLPDDMIAARLDVNRQPGAADVYQKVNWWVDYDLRQANGLTRDDLRNIQQPVLGVCEVADRVLVIVQAMFEALPNSKLYRVDGVGHWPHYETPDQFNTWALEHLTA
jgi:2-hydroxy-6-oxonona-2,4-dienedioate hydrolase